MRETFHTHTPSWKNCYLLLLKMDVFKNLRAAASEDKVGALILVEAVQ